jgi:hypothetical protein
MREDRCGEMKKRGNYSGEFPREPGRSGTSSAWGHTMSELGGWNHRGTFEHTKSAGSNPDETVM